MPPTSRTGGRSLINNMVIIKINISSKINKIIKISRTDRWSLINNIMIIVVAKIINIFIKIILISGKVFMTAKIIIINVKTIKESSLSSLSRSL